LTTRKFCGIINTESEREISTKRLVATKRHKNLVAPIISDRIAERGILMTKTEMFTAIRENLVDAEQIAFIDHEIEMLAKRNANRSSKPTKAQLEKNAQREQIVNFLAENEKATCAEVADALGVTLHSATGLLTTLRKSGQVKREYEGKTPVYSLGSEIDAE